MGGKSVQFTFKASVDRVWSAALQSSSQLGYSILHTDGTSRVLSFNTGRSMSSWAGQDLSMTLSQDGSGTVMTMGGSLGKGGNPFGGGQLGSWGEKNRLIDKFAETVKRTLPSVPEPVVAAPAATTADELVKLAALRDAGVLTDAEFEVQKLKSLGR